MPTYDYHCLACEHAFAIAHSMKEAPRRKCPKCGKNQLERRIGPGAGIVFKGSGFYLTDYRSKSYQEAAKAEAKDASASNSSKSPDSSKSDAPKLDAAKPAESAKTSSDSSAAAAKPAPKPKRSKS